MCYIESRQEESKGTEVKVVVTVGGVVGGNSREGNGNVLYIE